MQKHLVGLAALLLAASLALTGSAAAGYVAKTPWPVPEEKAASDNFADVAGEWSWAAASVDLLYEKNIVGGIEGAFQPQSTIRRGDLLLLVFRALGLEGDGAVERTPFQDVKADSPYAAAVTAAWEMGIVTGEDGLFRPYDGITREEAFTLLHRAALAVGAEELRGSGSLVMFADSPQLEPYARAAAANLVREGLIRGDGLLRPKDGISRAEAAVLICRLMSTELTGKEHIADGALAAAGLSREELETLTGLLEADMREKHPDAAGQPQIRPFYAEKSGKDRVRLYASVYLSGEYWCGVQTVAARTEDGFKLNEVLYSFG